MGYDEALGANAGGTLTKMDARYGRTIKRLQTCVVSGITDLVNLYLVHRGMSEKLDEFKIRVVSPTTVEDLDRDEQLQAKLGLVSGIMQYVQELPEVDAQKVLNYLLTNYLSDPSIADIIKDSKRNA